MDRRDNDVRVALLFLDFVRHQPQRCYGHLILSAITGNSVGESRYAEARFSNHDDPRSPSRELAAAF
jgi:hypothetical protein